MTLYKSNSKAGMTSIDFLMAMLIAMGIMSIIFAFSLTFTAAELTQYLTYAAARATNGSHANPQAQADAGQRKWRELTANPVVDSLFSGGWFVIPKDTPFMGTPEAGGLSEFYGPQQVNEGQLFGVWVGFSAEVLNFNIPLIGATSSNPGEEGNFVSTIGSFIGREPSQGECINFVGQRHENIIRLSPRYAPAMRGNQDIIITDNGC